MALLLGLTLLLGVAIFLDSRGWQYDPLGCRDDTRVPNPERVQEYVCNHPDHVGTFVKLRGALVLVCVCKDELRQPRAPLR
jgi:hypothetical protein